MKALVLEKRGELAAVLCEDGTYTTTAQSCEVGETVELQTNIVPFPRRQSRWLRSAVAAVLALVLFTGSYAYLAASAYAYVTLDAGEASVEVAVNRLGRVISVSPINVSSEELAKSLTPELRGKKLGDALPEVMERILPDGAGDGSDALLIAGVTSGTEEQREALAETVEQAAERLEGEKPTVYTFEVPPEERRTAEEKGMSGGRFAFEKQNPAQTETPPAETQESSGTQGGQPGGAQETQQVPQIGTQNTTPAASSGAPDASGKPRAPGGSVRPAQTGSAGGVMPSGGSGEPAQPAGLPDQQEPPAAPAQETGSEPSGQPDGEAQPGGEGQPGDVPQPGGESQPSTEQTPPAGGEQSQQASPPDMGPDGQPSNQPGSEAQPGGESQPGGGSQTAAEQPGQGEPDRQPSAPLRRRRDGRRA